MQPASGSIWFPTPASTSSFPTGKAVFLRSPSPARLRKRVHPLVGFTPLQSPAVSCPPRASRRGAPPVGFAFPLRDINQRHPYDGVPSPPTFRPRRFSRPRRFPPPPALWVYFTPQPRPGFALQGLVPRTQPRYLVDTALPSRRYRRPANVSCPTPPRIVDSPSGLCSVSESAARPSGFNRRPSPFPS